MSICVVALLGIARVDCYSDTWAPFAAAVTALRRPVRGGRALVESVIGNRKLWQVLHNKWEKLLVQAQRRDIQLVTETIEFTSACSPTI